MHCDKINDVFSCDTGKSEFNNGSLLKNHIMTNPDVSNNKINEAEKIVEDCSNGNQCTVTKVNYVFPCDTCKSEFSNVSLLKNHIMTNPDVSNNKMNEAENIVEDCSKGNQCTVTKVNDVFPCDTCKSEFCNGKGVDNSTEKIHWRCHTLKRCRHCSQSTGQFAFRSS